MKGQGKERAGGKSVKGAVRREEVGGTREKGEGRKVAPQSLPCSLTNPPPPSPYLGKMGPGDLGDSVLTKRGQGDKFLNRAGISLGMQKPCDFFTGPSPKPYPVGINKLKSFTYL